MSIPFKAQAKSSVVNNAFVSRTTDTSTSGKLDLTNAAAVSGPSVTNLQRLVNSLASAMGMTTAEVYNYLFTWSSDSVGSPNDTVKQRVDALVSKFLNTGGHSHNGTDGQGPKLTPSNFDQFNNYFSSYQSTTFNGASGLTTDVSTAFSTKTAGGSTASYGVVTVAPNNKVDILHADDGTWIENGTRRVYAYLTESSGVWTLTYYYRDNSNVEQPYNLPSHNLIIVFREVFSAGNRPTFDSALPIDSITMDITADVIDASLTERGLVNTGAQAFAGEKDFIGLRVNEELFLEYNNDNTSGSDVNLPDPIAPTIRLTNAGLSSIRMIDSVKNLKTFIAINATGADITIKNLTGPTATKQIITGTGADYNFKSNASILFIYDPDSSKWRMIGTHTSTGGGGGGMHYTSVTTKTGNYTVIGTDEVVQANTVSSDITFTLPAVPTSGDRFLFKKIHANNKLTITGSHNIDDVASLEIFTKNVSVAVYFDGTQWRIET